MSVEKKFKSFYETLLKRGRALPKAKRLAWIQRYGIKDEVINQLFVMLSDDEKWELLNAFPEVALQLNQENMGQLYKKANPYQKPIQEGADRYMCVSVTNLKESYLRRELMTGLTGFIFKMLEEHEIDEDKLEVPSVEELMEKIPEPTGTEGTSAAEGKGKEATIEGEESEAPIIKTRKQLAKEKQQTLIDEERTYVKEHIYKFLSHYLEFNPNIHVKSAENDREGDPSRKEPSGPEAVKHAVEKTPPLDTFHRWKYYMDVNYDALRQVTVDKFCHKPYLDWCIMPYGVHFETPEEAQKYVRKHADQLPTDARVCKAWNWTFMQSFKDNRDRVNYNNDQTIILEKILRNIEEEAKLGRDMMKKRVQVKKKENIDKEGPDDSSFEVFKREYPTALGSYGVEHVEGPIKEEELPPLEEPIDDLPKEAVEVGVHIIKNKVPDHLGRGGGVEMESGVFHSESERPESVNVIRPGEDPTKSKTKDKALEAAMKSGLPGLD